MTEDNLKKILEKVYDEEVRHISLGDIENGNIDFSRGRIFTFDTITNENMKTIIKKGIETNKKILWVGTAAIADNLFEIEYKTYPSIAIIGRVSSVTENQVKFAENSGVTMVQVPMYDLITNKPNVEAYVNKAIGII